MKVILFMAISLNGFIADEKGKEDFISHDNWLEFVRLANKCGNFIYGRKTYEEVKTWPQSYFDDLKNVKKVVVSTTLKEPLDLGFTPFSSPLSAIESLKKHGFDEILLSGGSQNNTSFLKEKLIDEIILNIEPAILGKGVPLFASGDFEFKLQLIDSKKISDQTVQLHYEVVK